ncbi:hypothetical protein GCM10029964_018300 [Kibdelosporangium lantanae]
MPPDRVLDLHQRGLDALNRGRPLVGARALRAGLKLASEPAMTVRLLNSLAAAEAALGNTEHGFALLDRADALATPATEGLLLQQRGLLLVLVGRMDDALTCLDQAVPLLRKERTVLARTLLNRAMIHQIAGRVTPALADLDRCERLGRELDLWRLVAKAIHGRGSCQLLAGNIPAALRDFDDARALYEEYADGMLPVLAVERARALLAAGLHRDAATELDFALDTFPRTRMDQEHAEAQLTRAQAALAAGDLPGARTWANRAEGRFRRRGNETWAAVAAVTRLRAEFAAGSRVVARHAADLAHRLGELGLANDAEAAGLVAARAYIRSGRPEARDHIRQRGGPLLENRLTRALALAELGAAEKDRKATFRHARAGLKLLHDHRSRIGSLDLRTSTTVLGRELATVGLAAALDDGRPSVVYGWLERSRAQAFRFQPVRPPADSVTVEAVAELRQLAHQVRVAELAGRRDPEARRRCAQLERRIRARGWHAEGAGEHAAAARFAEVKAALGDIVMVSYASVADSLWALVVRRDKARLVRLGSLALVSESLAKAHSDLDALCGRQLPAALDQVIRTSSPASSACWRSSW